jgi:hypothetical protein
MKITGRRLRGKSKRLCEDDFEAGTDVKFSVPLSERKKHNYNT